MNHNYYVYILTNKTNNVLYTGVTNDLVKRVFEHKNKIIKGFTSKYNVSKLIYFEHFTSIEYAIRREKQIKGWKRFKKIDLIESVNTDWKEIDPK
ncbi:MAG: GIY-YIG nuclease family protein [Calditrichaeota bacterium]|nr:MAG: GIY-YIG nuclease family protein [Calditrichota bacterium]MBL1206844.1 GIY-YIG nuclease family protein [Calditrichota bacterium]NOG46671.1 GIY-YIG nuclease family protein [Calditrichota bacterium]